jgi:hypothetical protein
VYYRVSMKDDSDAAEQARKAINNVSHESEMREELCNAVNNFFEYVRLIEKSPAIGDFDRERLIHLAMITCNARSPVERHPITREVLWAPVSEAPARLAGVLMRLLCGLRAIGAEESVSWKVIAKVALDSIPPPRRDLLEGLARKPGTSFNLTTLTAMARCSKSATRRALEELELLNVAERYHGVTPSGDTWGLTNSAREHFSALDQAVSQPE